MKKIGLIFLFLGFGALIFFTIIVSSTKKKIMNPIPSDEKIKVIFLSPSP